MTIKNYDCPRCGNKASCFWRGGDLVLVLCKHCDAEYVMTYEKAKREGYI